MLSLYTMRLSLISGEDGGGEDGDGDGVFVAAAVDVWASVVVFCVLAASVVIWEACAFAAMAAALAAAAAAWCAGLAAGARAGPPPAGELGLTDAAIDDALPAFAYGDHESHAMARESRRADLAAGGGATCSVCLEEVRGGEAVRRVPACRHLFHAGCIDAWLRWRPTCPLCRSDLSPRRRATTTATAAATSLSPPSSRRA
ncbi:hypothetical protein ACP4OV_009186 [Aristida adscensionis]